MHEDSAFVWDFGSERLGTPIVGPRAAAPGPGRPAGGRRCVLEAAGAAYSAASAGSVFWCGKPVSGPMAWRSRSKVTSLCM